MPRRFVRVRSNGISSVTGWDWASLGFPGLSTPEGRRSLHRWKLRNVSGIQVLSLSCGEQGGARGRQAGDFMLSEEQLFGGSWRVQDLGEKLKSCNLFTNLALS